MELKITASPELLQALTEFVSAIKALTTVPEIAEGAPRRGRPPKAQADPKPENPKAEAPKAEPPKAEAPSEPEPGEPAGEDFALPGEPAEAVDVAALRESIRSTSLKLSKASTQALASLRTLFAKYKIQKLSDLSDDKVAPFSEELAKIEG